MSIRMHHLLAQWYPQRDDCDWVLGTIIGTERSAYRKAGAMMLFSERGQRLGMLSGGCLEDNLMREASKTLSLRVAHTVTYDLELDDADPNSWREAIGCGGAVTILLQVINSGNHYLGLDQVHQHLQKQQAVLYRQRLDTPGHDRDHWQCQTLEACDYRNLCRRVEEDLTDDSQAMFLETAVFPAPQLMIMGGGMDAVPLARLAADIGWQVSVVDARRNYARAEDFPTATIIKQRFSELSQNEAIGAPDALVIMSHNLHLDSQALRFAHHCGAAYVGILGPEHRRQKVEALAGLRPRDFKGVYRGPVGLEIGAKLPETIALAILAECHQYIEGDRQRGLESGALSGDSSRASHS